MDYKLFNADTWATLHSPADRNAEIRTAILSDGQPSAEKVHVFKDADGHLHCAMEVDPSAAAPVRNLRGMRCGISEFVMENRGNVHMLDLCCMIRGFTDEFSVVVKHIAREVFENGRTPVDAVTKVTRNWMTFWGNKPDDTLSEEKVIGLFCELLTLQSAMAHDPAKAIAAWDGPKGAKHDFSFDTGCIEVKGTRKPGRSHTITGIEQLVPPDQRTLHVASFNLDPAGPDAGTGFVDLIREIRKTLESTPDLQSEYGDLLMEAGYHPAHAELYEGYRYHVNLVAIHLVDEGFPRLVPDMITGSLNYRIDKIRYDIDLDGIQGPKLDDFDWSSLTS